MDAFAGFAGDATDEASGKDGGIRLRIPDGVFKFEEEPEERLGEAKEDRKRSRDADWESFQRTWWHADAWAESTMDLPAFLLTFAYEVLPPLISGPLCWLMEGKVSAQNRLLLPIAEAKLQPLQFAVQCCFTVPAWASLILWLVARPDEVPAIDVLFPFLLTIWRAACIAMKYAYYAPSELERVRRSFHYRRTNHSRRNLGQHKYFNVAGTLAFDHLEHLFKAALRLDMLDEVTDTYLSVAPDVARQVWEQVRACLEPQRMDVLLSTHVPGAPSWRSKYGDVQALLGLANLSAIDWQVMEGQLPVSVVAYYFLSRAWSSSQRRTLVLKFVMLGCSLAFLHPAVHLLDGKAAFGTSAAGHVIYGLRAFCLCILLMPVFLYLAYPVVDSFVRYRMSWSLISAFGRGEARARRLCRNLYDPPFRIEEMGDLRAFWCLSRLLGPIFEIGLLVRYNSAYVAVHVFFLCLATAGMLGASMLGEASLGVSAELSVLFVCGSAAVIMASLLCVSINWQVPMYMGLVRQAALQHPELGGVAKDVCEDFQTEHLEMNPVQLMYIPATPALLSLLWSGLVVLAGIFVASLPSVCLPLLFSGGCV